MSKREQAGMFRLELVCMPVRSLDRITIREVSTSIRSPYLQRYGFEVGRILPTGFWWEEFSLPQTCIATKEFVASTNRNVQICHSANLVAGRIVFILRSGLSVLLFIYDTQLRWHDSGCCDTYGRLSYVFCSQPMSLCLNVKRVVQTLNLYFPINMQYNGKRSRAQLQTFLVYPEVEEIRVCT